MRIFHSLIIGASLVFLGCSGTSLTGSEAGNARVAFTLVTPAGAPVVGEQIDLYKAGEMEAFASQLSDSSGFVLFEQLPYGEYQLLTTRTDSLLFRPITLSERHLVLVDTLQEAVTLRCSRPLIPANKVRLVGTPIERSIAFADTDSTSTVSGFPEGSYTVELADDSVALRSTNTATFTEGVITNLDTLDWQLLLAPTYGAVLGGALYDQMLLLWTKTSALTIASTGVTAYRLGTDIQGTTFSSATISEQTLYLASDQEIVAVPATGPRTTFAVEATSRISAMTPGFAIATSHYAGISRFDGIDSTGLLGVSVPTNSHLITSFYADTDTSLYFGSNKNGVLRWIQGSPMVADTSFMGAKSLIIHDILSDNQKLWIATSSSLMSRDGAGVWSTYYQGSSFARVARDSAQALWFAMPSGDIYTLQGSAVNLAYSTPEPLLNFSLSRAFHFITTATGGYLKRAP